MMTRALLVLAATMAAADATLFLNFGAVSNPAFGTAGNLTLQYPSVASGINATLTAAAPFTSFTPTNNGSVLGDARVNAANLTTINLTLAIWDATSGTGFNVPYNPGSAYDFSYGFFDIDGGAGTYDVVTIYTPGSYTLTTTSTLVVTTSPGQISFSGIASPEVPGQGGITSLSNAQADVAAIYHVSNLNTLLFDYTIGVSGTPVANGRNLLLDGDNLSEAWLPTAR